jgi:DNA-binding transcriptional ArsR family regulator
MAKKGRSDSTKAELALMFKALGDPTRLDIFRFLRARCWPVTVEDGEDRWMVAGPTVSEVCCAVSGSKKITAKISHHLKEMRLAGLIIIRRRGKNMICGVKQEAITVLSDFLNTVETLEAPGTAETAECDEPEGTGAAE